MLWKTSQSKMRAGRTTLVLRPRHSTLWGCRSAFQPRGIDICTGDKWGQWGHRIIIGLARTQSTSTEWGQRGQLIPS